VPIWEVWRFVAEGLKPAERRHVRVFGPLSIVCFSVGLLFNYAVLTPVSIRYLATYGAAERFESAVTVDGYLNLFFGLSLAMGAVFELPLVLVFCRLIGVVSADSLKRFRRYFLFGATVFAAFITPTGDPWTLALVTVPLLLLYELGIQAVRVVESRLS
ncbi:twin-arginine translocase subunit TatC, partial [Planctomycetota bacterium]